MVQGSSAGVTGWADGTPGDADVYGDPGQFPQTKSRREIEEYQRLKKAIEKGEQGRSTGLENGRLVHDRGWTARVSRDDQEEGRSEIPHDIFAQHT